MDQTGGAPNSRADAQLLKPAASQHIVDVLIEERARHLRSHPAAWFLIQRLLYPLLRYRAAIKMADAIASLPGRQVFTQVAEDLRLKLEIEGLEHVPREGPCMIVANHPTGIVDGIALFQALKGVRDDVCFVANRDALRVSPGLADNVIPVEWVIEKRTLAKTREMWRLTRAAFERGKAVVMFPSGRVARLKGFKLVDREWQSASLAFATRNNAPIIPLHISAWNSWIYYFFSRTSPELRDMTLFNELLNKRGRTFGLKFAPAIPPTDLAGDPEQEIIRLRNFIEAGLRQGARWGGTNQLQFARHGSTGSP
ncbi:MAG: 1-acyl-sn-glycerol-3-phosphate acyltransferase [Alphaproteobacteria bacterium]